MEQKRPTRGSAYCIAIGLAASALGSLFVFAIPSPPAHDQNLLTALAGFLLVIGAPIFVTGIVVEFLSIGTHLRKLEATLSLLLPPRPIANPPASRRVKPKPARHSVPAEAKIEERMVA